MQKREIKVEPIIIRTEQLESNEILDERSTNDIPVSSNAIDDYSCNTTILDKPIEVINQHSYNQNSYAVKTEYKADVERKSSIFSKIKTFFKI